MEFGSIRRDIEVRAIPEVVFQVVTQPEHIAKWWGFDAVVEVSMGATGSMSKPRRDGEGTFVVQIAVVEVDAPRRFSFRWVHPERGSCDRDNSLLVTFDLEATANGTLLHLTEEGFREVGWEANPPGLTPWARLGFYVDAAEVFWQDWVLNYNLDRQLQLATRMGGKEPGRAPGLV